jgi:two-component system NarL family sensor kinase
VENADTLLALDREYGGFRRYLRSFEDLDALQRDLVKRFKFLGRTCAYFFPCVCGRRFRRTRSGWLATASDREAGPRGPDVYHPPVGKLGPVARAVLTFTLLGLLVLVLVGVSGTLVLRRLATDQAISEALDFTEFASRVVQRRVTDELIAGEARASAAIAGVVFDAVLHDPVVRVKIWTADGTIVYSDESRLIGETYELGNDELEAIETGGVTAELSDLEAPENRFDRGHGDLLEVYTSIETPGGTPLLFETYQRFSSIANSQSRLLTSFAPVLVVALVAFAAIEIPLAWALARRVQRAQADRERYLQRAVDASDRERRRIAGDLHDGPVQDLAGLAMRLSAAAESTDDDAAHETLSDAAGATRASIRTLRSAVVGVYPPNLQQAGLGPALSDLTARLQQEGLAVILVVDPPTGFDPDVDALLYRACQEALRNVDEHARATRVEVTVRRDGPRAVLEVADDGRGIEPDEASRARQAGHVGLQILEDLVRDAGGSLALLSRDGGGTVMRVEVPT